MKRVSDKVASPSATAASSRVHHTSPPSVSCAMSAHHSAASSLRSHCVSSRVVPQMGNLVVNSSVLQTWLPDIVT